MEYNLTYIYTEQKQKKHARQNRFWQVGLVWPEGAYTHAGLPLHM